MGYYFKVVTSGPDLTVKSEKQIKSSSDTQMSEKVVVNNSRSNKNVASTSCETAIFLFSSFLFVSSFVSYEHIDGGADQ